MSPPTRADGSTFDGLVPAVRDYDPRLLARAGGGRTRGTALELLEGIVARPLAADATLRYGLRRARHLHSAERRFVGDLAHDFLRYHRLAAAAFGPGVADFYDGWLSAQRDGDAAWRAAAAAVAEADALAVLGSLLPGFAAALTNVADPLALIAASNQRAPLTVRANRIRTSRAALAERLAAEGVPTRAGSDADALTLLRPVDVHTLDTFREGWFEVQDEGSQRIGALVGGGNLLVDFCAGAGGKTLQLAALHPDAQIVACDVRADALDALRERSRRAGARRVQPLHITEAGPIELRARSADAVLVDAPCTGSGTLRRHPELRYRIDHEELARTTRLQREILARAAPLVRPGGRLVYATCSVLPAENEQIVAAFCSAHQEFHATEPPVRTRPDRDDSDGFYAQALTRAD